MPTIAQQLEEVRPPPQKQELQQVSVHSTISRRLPSSFELFISAAVSGLVTKTVCAPMDRLRLLYQVQGMLQHSAQQQQQQHSPSRIALQQSSCSCGVSPGVQLNRNLNEAVVSGKDRCGFTYKGGGKDTIRYTKYRGILSGLRLVVEEEGLKGLWRGNGVNAVRAAACYAIKFPANDLAKRALSSSSINNNNNSNNNNSNGSSRPSMGSLLLSGALAGSLQKTLSYPLDLLSVRIAVGINADQLGKHHETVAAVAAAAAPPPNSSSSGSATNGPYPNNNRSVSGLTMSSSTKSWKTNKDNSNINSSSRKGYNGVVDCARRVWQLEGPSGFFKGFSVTLLSGVPYVMLQMSFFDLSQRTLGDAAQRRSAGGSWPLVLLTAGVSVVQVYRWYPVA
ncbi:mitochondrial carrier domain-containing protein, putative [Eimeria maxima]|uniref:Mitochondrial carrier domain-containing protein, putative n=1 Tax=Eimeria maxima TaxID=5804 RepID=U6MG60_EIMMA|nr:mitochondrial carrier domain-containing protein, putative [Eimeria maxima]CDJ60625.1 mitochondrial carrier domain-containing protein, putative [Eimeria maxima]